MSPSISTPDTRHLDLAVHGMHCAGCVARVEKALAGVPGVEGAAVNLALEQARVRLSRATPATTDELLRALVRAGYRAEVQSDEPAPPTAAGATVTTLESPPPTRELLVGALVSSVFMAEMALHFTRLDWRLPPWLALALATVVQAWVGARFYAGAWSTLRARTATMDTLVVLGTSAAYGLSAYGVFAGHAAHGAHSYFEAASVVVTLVLLGKWLEARARRSTGEALRSLMQLRPSMARILAADGSTRDVPIGEVKVGDRVLVRPGERLPVDGEIEAGEAQLDESLLTGESLPVPRGPGARVVTGAVNLDGALTLRTRAVGADTSLAKIIGLVRGAQASKPRIQHQVDRVAAIFVPTVLVLAGTTLVGWWLFAGDLTRGVDAAIAVLVVACPCALGLATPAALIVGTGLGARHGILIRDADALESAARIDVVLFDKTGTLTEGTPTVVSVHAESGESESSMLALAASLQQHSEHPLARAILARAAAVRAPSRPCKRFVAVAGRGVRGEVDERTLLLGNARLLTEQGIVLPDTAPGAATVGQGGGATVVWLAQVAPEPRVLGWFAATDSVRPNAKQAVAALHTQGFSTALVSGDQRAVAEHVAAELGVGATHAPMLPAEKLAVLHDLRAAGQRVAMVGDGVNDAPALAAADVGIAMGTGTDVAVNAAGITLMRPDPRLVVDALLLARLTQRKIWQNLFWAFVYNVLAIPAAITGALSPVLAGAAMAFSSVSVVTNALLLRRVRLSAADTTKHE